MPCSSYLLFAALLYVVVSEEAVWTPDTIVVQYGYPRSASTLQWETLCTLVTVKLMSLGKGSRPSCRFLASEPTEPLASFSVLKAHRPRFDLKALTKWGRRVMVFYSASRNDDKWPGAIVTQHFEDVSVDALGSLKKYVKIFNLTKSEENRATYYLKAWDILRLCCGGQQSLANRLRLHGCAPLRLPEDPLDPHCDYYNLTAVEENHFDNDVYKYLYKKPYHGRCQKQQDLIVQGLDLNGEHFETCAKLIQKWGTKTDSTTSQQGSEQQRRQKQKTRH